MGISCLGVLKERSSILQLFAETAGRAAMRAVEIVESFMVNEILGEFAFNGREGFRFELMSEGYDTKSFA